MPNLPFKEIYAVEKINAINEASRIAIIFQEAIETHGYFNLNQAIAIAQEQAEMTIVNTVDKFIVQAYAPVKQIIDRLHSLCNSILNATSSKSLYQQIYQAIYHAFIGLDTQEQAKCLVYQRKSNYSTTYHYNLIFTVQNKLNGNFINYLIIGLTIKISKIQFLVLCVLKV